MDKVSTVLNVIGAYGKVVTVKSVETSQNYAMKIISKKLIENLRMIDQLKNEVTIMQKMHHENIVSFNTLFEDSRNIYLVLELAEKGHLYKRLKAQGTYNEATAAKYMFDILKSVNYLHEQTPPIIHRDIKPENILFSNGQLKLADFGWSNMKDRVRTTFCGTPDYLAPEMLLERGHNEKLDVWTCGILMYELIIGKAPFSPPNTIKDKKKAQKLLEKNIMENKPIFSGNISKEAVELISAMLSKKPNSRPSCRDALKHDWFVKNGLIFTDEVHKEQEGPASNLFKNIRTGTSGKIGPKSLEGDDDVAPPDFELEEETSSKGVTQCY